MSAPSIDRSSAPQGGALLAMELVADFDGRRVGSAGWQLQAVARAARPPHHAPRPQIGHDLGDSPVGGDEHCVDREAHEEHVDRWSAFDPEALARLEPGAAQQADRALAKRTGNQNSIADEGVTGDVANRVRLAGHSATIRPPAPGRSHPQVLPAYYVGSKLDRKVGLVRWQA